MAEFALQVKIRERANKHLDTMRKQGSIPAVMYGHGLKPQMFWVQYVKFSQLYAKAGESSIIEVTPEKGKTANVIINDVQLDPLTSRFSHIDFFQVRMDEKLEAHIPLEFVGEAPAVREMGGIFVKPVDQILVSCLPKDLPHSFVVDISILHTFENHIQIKDLKIPSGVTILTEADTTIALVEAPRTEAEMAALDEKVEADVTKVEGVVKEEAPVVEEGAAKDAKAAKAPEEKK
ncbi:MAG: 50S ribosomal protein L25 [Candidatus Moraniibacteriota bacterium]